ncbi:hypothetical protein ACLMJK_000425 [Lecanora helva]
MSGLSRVLPIVVLFIVVAVAAFVGYVIYTIATDIANKTSQKMEKKNVSFGKEGMKIGVKEIKSENYVDQTQSILVKAWNYSSWPAYKSRLWNKENEQPQKAQSRSPPADSPAPVALIRSKDDTNLMMEPLEALMTNL